MPGPPLARAMKNKPPARAGLRFGIVCFVFSAGRTPKSRIADPDLSESRCPRAAHGARPTPFDIHV
eukprot:2199900-Lingulodinium_polyedra.AAC.1